MNGFGDLLRGIASRSPGLAPALQQRLMNKRYEEEKAAKIEASRKAELLQKLQLLMQSGNPEAVSSAGDALFPGVGNPLAQRMLRSQAQERYNTASQLGAPEQAGEAMEIAQPGLGEAAKAYVMAQNKPPVREWKVGQNGEYYVTGTHGELNVITRPIPEKYTYSGQTKDGRYAILTNQDGIVLNQRLPYEPDPDFDPVEEANKKAEGWSNLMFELADEHGKEWSPNRMMEEFKARAEEPTPDVLGKAEATFARTLYDFDMNTDDEKAISESRELGEASLQLLEYLRDNPDVYSMLGAVSGRFSELLNRGVPENSPYYADFNALMLNLQDILGRSRSGGAITEDEFSTFRQIVGSPVNGAKGLNSLLNQFIGMADRSRLARYRSLAERKGMFSNEEGQELLSGIDPMPQLDLEKNYGMSRLSRIRELQELARIQGGVLSEEDNAELKRLMKAYNRNGGQ